MERGTVTVGSILRGGYEEACASPAGHPHLVHRLSRFSTNGNTKLPDLVASAVLYLEILCLRAMARLSGDRKGGWV